MSVGVVLTLSPSRLVVMRQPVWPFPPRGDFPRRTPSGEMQYFLPIPYYNFPLNQPIPAQFLHFLSPEEQP